MSFEKNLHVYLRKRPGENCFSPYLVVSLSELNSLVASKFEIGRVLVFLNHETQKTFKKKLNITCNEVSAIFHEYIPDRDRYVFDPGNLICFFNKSRIKTIHYNFWVCYIAVARSLFENCTIFKGLLIINIL